MAARFVSMIPVIQSHMLYPGQLDIWLTANVSFIVLTCMLVNLFLLLLFAIFHSNYYYFFLLANSGSISL